uniref:LamG-like jellyroll fold domain-containing protein n=1 Tax=Aureoumbra lagunensis TaxID=44058 RepID=A0A7S3JRD6_9STRA
MLCISAFALLIFSAALSEEDVLVKQAWIESVSSDACMYDRVESAWEYIGNNVEELEIGLVSEGVNVALLGSVRYDIQEEFQEELLLFEEATMGPARVTSMSWEPPDRRLIINFQEATNQFEIADAVALRRVLNMSIRLKGVITCRWIGAKQLEALVLDAPEAYAVDAAFRNGTFTVAAAPARRKARSIQGNHTARIAIPGIYNWVLLHRDEIIARSTKDIRIKSCDDSLVDTLYTTKKNNSVLAEENKSPWFEAIGTLTLTGQHQALQLPDDELPGSLFPSSLGGTLSFWLFGLEADFPQAHRALFFKGDVARLGGQRTPSAWLLPGSGRLALRISADAEYLDAGVDSFRPAARYGNWTHLAFVWTKEFKYQLYIDGALDCEFSASPVLFNDGPLYLGRDPDRPGPIALFANIRLWPTPLSSAEIRALLLRKDDIRLTPPSWLLFHRQMRKNEDGLHAHKEAEEAGCDMPTSERLALYETSAALGDGIAARRAAEILLYGAERYTKRSLRCPSDIHLEYNILKAEHYLRIALELNRQDANAARELGFLLLFKGITQEAWGLLVYAAALNDARAQLALAQEAKNQHQIETAAWLMRLAAETANNEFHTPGEQTLAEMDALSEVRLSKGPEKAQRGENDAELQAQIARAEQGDDVQALISTADLFYWGARGFTRDHARARRYLQHAVQAHDHTHAMALYAAMLLRGEGGPANHEEALKFYEKAASRGSVAALNGLGYEYFFGTGSTPANKSKAFHYFLEATAYNQDGDSYFNAAHCLHQGHGTRIDLPRAATLYERGAAQFGHFDASLQLAYLRYNGGTHLPRSAHLALKYFEACAKAGWLARDLRAGFDSYLDRQPYYALAFYAQAAYIGFPLAAKNAAFLLDRPKLFFQSNYTDRTLAKRFHRMALALNFDPESALALANHLLQDGDCISALRWLSRSAQAAHGPAVAKLADLNALGYCLPQQNTNRAERLYRRATDLDRSLPMRVSVALRMAALRLGYFQYFFGNNILSATSCVESESYMPIKSDQFLYVIMLLLLSLLLLLLRIRLRIHRRSSPRC